jgi:hypothetical protein
MSDYGLSQRFINGFKYYMLKPLDECLKIIDFIKERPALMYNKLHCEEICYIEEHNNIYYKCFCGRKHLDRLYIFKVKGKEKEIIFGSTCGEKVKDILINMNKTEEKERDTTCKECNRNTSKVESRLCSEKCTQINENKINGIYKIQCLECKEIIINETSETIEICKDCKDNVFNLFENNKSKKCRECNKYFSPKQPHYNKCQDCFKVNICSKSKSKYKSKYKPKCKNNKFTK